MTDLAHDRDGSQIEREISIAEAHLARVNWYETFQSNRWQDWPEDVQLRFLHDVPTVTPQDLAQFSH